MTETAEPFAGPRLVRPSGTTVRGTVAAVLLVVGGLAGAPAVVVLGLVGLVITVVHAVWARRGLRHVEYRRVLESNRVIWGNSLPVSIESGTASACRWRGSRPRTRSTPVCRSRSGRSMVRSAPIGCSTRGPSARSSGSAGAITSRPISGACSSSARCT